MEVCPTSAAKHSWVFDGDDPYVTCHFCNEMRDAISGVVVRAGVILPPLIESGGAPTRKAGASGNAEANETTPGVSARSADDAGTTTPTPVTQGCNCASYNNPERVRPTTSGPVPEVVLTP